MDDPHNRYLKQLSHTLLFMLSREEFHTHQIKTERQRLRNSISKCASNHRKLEHLQGQQEKLEMFLRMHPELKERELYQLAGKVLSDSLRLTK